MTYIFILMFLFFIIAPFLYLQHTLVLSKNKLITYRITTLMIMIMTLLRLLLKSDLLIMVIMTYISDIYIITSIAFALMIFVYRSFHKPLTFKVSIIFLCLSLAICFIGIYQHHHKVVTTYDVTINKTSSIEGLEIGMISDIHLGTGTSLNQLQILVNQMNDLSFDVVMLCGDIIDESTPLSMIDEAYEILGKINTTYGIYAIDGNHELYTNLSLDNIYQQNNIHYLYNQYVCVDGLFNIIGRDDASSHNDIDVSSLYKGMNLDLPTIVLDHNPRRYEQMKGIGDLQLSGHTHNGQIFPGNLLISLLYDNAYGYSHDGISLIVGSGYGSWGFPYRLLTKCEILRVNVGFVKI